MINAVTEVIDKYMRESSVDPDQEARIINLDGMTNIFSVGNDQSLYLTKENESGQKSKFDRYKLVDQVTSFAAEKVDDQTIAVAVVSGDAIYLVYTEKPEELNLGGFRKMDFSGAIGGIHLAPSRVFMTSRNGQVTLFAEFHDDSGFVQQFSAVLADRNDTNANYFRLPSEFTDVVGTDAGRSARQFVDGTYTFGVFHAGNDFPFEGFDSDAPQLIYTPSRNPFGSTPPSPIRLKVEENLEAICTQKSTDESKPETHLFAAGGGKLYFYPYQEQYDYIQQNGKGVPQVIAESDNVLNAEQIGSYILSGRLYIFIRTAGGELNYTVADYQDDMPGKFLEPVNFMNDVVGFDIEDGKIAVLTKDEFIECIHDPVTGAFKMDSITVSTELDTHTCFSAYSTRINVGTVGEDVTIASQSGEKISFYADDCYYKTKKAVLKSDSLGYVTIVQKAKDISPDCYTVTCGEETLEVDPVEAVRQKFLSMTDESDFQNAVITDPFGNTTPLVTENKQSALAAAAAGMASLRNSAAGLIPGYDNPITNFENGVMMTIMDKAISILPASVTDNPFTQFVAEAVNDITAAFKWVIGKVKKLYDDTVGKVVNLVVQKTATVWKLFVEIGGKVIHVVLDCAAKVMEGIRNILEIIGIPVDKILAFFKKALCLDTAAKINAAIKNMIDISMDLLIDKTSELKETSVEFLTNAVEEIDKWADIDEKSLSDISLPDLTAKNTNILGDMGISLDSHNMFFYDLMKNTVMDSISLPAITMSDSLETAIKTLLDDMREIAGDIERIPASLTYIAEEIEGLLQKFTAADFLAVAKKILGVVADEFLLISKSLLKLIFDVVIEGIRLIWQALNTNISIPFLSDVLSVFGIHEFSMVDLVIYPIASLTAMLDGAGKLFSGETIVAPEAMEMLSKVKSIDELKNGGVSYV